MQLRYKDKILGSITNVSQEFLVNSPIGSIIAWAKTESEIPEGWHVCDGTEGTIDLRDKFILGAGSTHSPNDTGGEEEVTLTVEQLPQHTHGINIRQNETLGLGAYIQSGVYNSTYKTAYTLPNGSNQPHNNMPPYYALLYIQKIAESPTDYATEERVRDIVNEIMEAPPIESTNDYSMDETVIGTWIDGKPIYRKIITGNFPTANGNNIVTGLKLTNAETVITLRGGWTASDGVSRYCIPHCSTKQSGDVGLITWSSNVYLNVNITPNTLLGGSMWIMAEWTKTTDAATVDISLASIPVKTSSDQLSGIPVTASTPDIQP